MSINLGRFDYKSNVSDGSKGGHHEKIEEKNFIALLNKA